jgi:hypothetical protein
VEAASNGNFGLVIDVGRKRMRKSWARILWSRTWGELVD